MTRYDILIPGNYFCDMIFTGIPRPPTLGTEVYTQGLCVTAGGVLNTVVALQRLGVSVGWLGQVGNDVFSRFVLETALAEGIDTTLLTRLDMPFQRVTVALSYPHDRAFISYVDNSPSPVQMVFDAIDTLSFRHIHFTGLQLDPHTAELLDIMHTRGISVSMDCQDRPVTLETPGIRELIGKLSIFMPNAREAMQLTQCDSLHSAAEILRLLVPILVIKDGPQGAYAWHDGAVYHAAALDVSPVDVTGAGDVFNAGFLMAYLRDAQLIDCLRYGNVCGGLSTLGVGGTQAAPHREQAETQLRIDAERDYSRG